MEANREYIESCIRTGAFDIMDEPGIFRGFNMGDGRNLYLRRVNAVPESDEEFAITSVIEVSLRQGFSKNGSINDVPLVRGTQKLYLYGVSDIGRAAEYFNYKINEE